MYKQALAHCPEPKGIGSTRFWWVFPFFIIFLKKKKNNSDNLSEILTLKRATTAPRTQILKYWTNICKPKEVFGVWVCGKRFGSYSAIIPKVFDEMSKLISPPPKLKKLICNNKAYPISINRIVQIFLWILP